MFKIGFTSFQTYVFFRKHGYTVLMLASRMGYSEIVQLLLADSRVDVNIRDKVRLDYTLF